MKLITAETVEKHTETSGVRNEIDEILAPVLLAARIYGLQVLDPNWSLRNNALNYIFSLLLITYAIIGTVVFMQNNDDALLFWEAIFSLILTFQYPLKLSLFFYYRSTLREVYIIAKTTIFSIIKEISPTKAAGILEWLKKAVKAEFLLVIVPAGNYLLTVFWFYCNGTRVPLSRTTSILMPLTSPCFEIGLVLHLIFFIMLAFGLTVVDLWFVFFTHFFCEASDCAVEILNVEKVKGEDDSSYANRLNESLGKFYSVHVKLMEYLNTLNEMYKWQILVPMTATLAITCLFLLVASEEANLQLFSVILASCVQIFAYNLMGEKVKSVANDMNMAILNFDWTSMKLKDKKSYYIIVCYMNKNFGFRSAIGVELSLLTLSSIYKGSYQMFAVMNTMKN